MGEVDLQTFALRTRLKPPNDANLRELTQKKQDVQ